MTLIPGKDDTVPDLIQLRPERTRRAETIALIDVYRYAIKCRVNKALLERARSRKELQAQRERAAIKRAEKRLTQPL